MTRPPTQPASPSGEVTRLLHADHTGAGGVLARIVPLLYDELRRVARQQLAREGRGGARTLQPTVLVHEAYLKLLAGGTIHAADRAHFLAIAAHAMRQVLVDQARARRSQKRGGGWEQTTLGDVAWSEALDAADLLALHEAIEQLEPRQRRVVECRFFGGMQEQEIAAALGVTERTVRRDWVRSRAWLYRALYGDGPR